MSGLRFPASTRKRRATTLAGLIIVQAICAMFFLGDLLFDLSDGDSSDNVHLIFEAIATIILASGVVYMMRELRELFNRVDAMEFGIRAARGEMAQLIETFFDQWQLTPSEREIALLVLKGIDNDSIAKMRGTAKGTVRAQCTQIYAKAQVDGRSQFLSVFLEELLHVEGKDQGIAKLVS